MESTVLRYLFRMEICSLPRSMLELAARRQYFSARNSTRNKGSALQRDIRNRQQGWGEPSNCSW